MVKKRDSKPLPLFVLLIYINSPENTNKTIPLNKNYINNFNT